MKDTHQLSKKRLYALLSLITIMVVQGAGYYVGSRYDATLAIYTFPFIFVTCLAGTISVASWCWFDAKIGGIDLPRSTYIVMALCGFFSVSRYFYLRLGPRGWFLSVFGLWQFVLAYVASLAGSYLAYAVILLSYAKKA
jgi:hypothetical protein